MTHMRTRLRFLSRARHSLSMALMSMTSMATSGAAGAAFRSTRFFARPGAGAGRACTAALATAATALLLTGCVTPHAENTALRERPPATILVLPPLNDSPDPDARAGVLAQATRPLAESGYYVVPVAVMEETFQQNGLTTAPDIHDVAPKRLREIFGADAALYIRIKEYGAAYRVIMSEVTVDIDATLTDLHTGTTLWTGSQRESYRKSADGKGLVGMLVQAMVDQAVNNLSNRSYEVAGWATQGLLSAGASDGLPYGPRSPHYVAPLSKQ